MHRFVPAVSRHMQLCLRNQHKTSSSTIHHHIPNRVSTSLHIWATTSRTSGSVLQCSGLSSSHFLATLDMNSQDNIVVQSEKQSGFSSELEEKQSTISHITATDNDLWVGVTNDSVQRNGLATISSVTDKLGTLRANSAATSQSEHSQCRPYSITPTDSINYSKNCNETHGESTENKKDSISGFFAQNPEQPDAIQSTVKCNTQNQGQLQSPSSNHGDIVGNHVDKSDQPVPPDPETCCGSGCVHCVWIKYVQEVLDRDPNDREKVREILDQIDDFNVKMFIKLELGL